MLEQQVAELQQALNASQVTLSAKASQPDAAQTKEEITNLKTKVDSLNDTLAKFASAARTLYNSHSQTLSTANNILKASKANTNGMDPNTVQSPETPSPPAIMAEPPVLLPDFDSSNPQATLDVLSTFNAQILDDAVMRIGSNSRKYLKLSKEYR